MQRRPYDRPAASAGFAMALGALFAAACDGTALDRLPVGGRPGDGGAAARDGAASADGSAAPGSDGALDGEPEDAGVRAPAAVNALAKRVAPEGAQLVGGGAAACTNQVPASGNGDRWCAFHRVSPSQRDELWVINVTAAATSAVACDGGDPNCLRLSNNLWTGETEDVSHPYAHKFDGDTLLFLSGRADLFEVEYEGTIYAWRPGWPKARAVSGPQAFSCTAHPRAPVVSCLENLDQDANEIFFFDLRAGRLDGPSVDGPLPLIDTIRPLRKDEAVGWQATFSASGDWFLYSTFTTAALGDPEVVYAYRSEELGTPAKRRKVGERFARAQLSADGTRLFYLKDFNYDRMGAPSGALTMVDFPAALTQTELATRVGTFLLLTDGAAVDRGLVYLTDVRAGSGAAKFMADTAKRAEPGGVVDIASDVADLQPAGGGQPFLFYNRRIGGDAIALTDLNVFRLPGAAPGGSCTLQREPSTLLLSDPLTTSGALTFWADNIDLDTGIIEGWYGGTADCTGKMKFANRVGAWRVIDDRGILYADDYDFQGSSTLKFAPIVGGKTLGAPVTIQEQIDGTFFGAFGARAELVIYGARNTAGDVDGIYLLAAPPWAGSPAVTPDAGAPTGDASP